MERLTTSGKLPVLAIYWYSPPEKSNTLRTKQSNGGKIYHPTRGNPGKTRVYLQKFRYTREIPGFDVALALLLLQYNQGPCANCGATRLLKYAHRTMCCRCKCQRAAAALRQARLAVRTTRLCQRSSSRSRQCSACASAIPSSAHCKEAAQ